MIPKEWEYRYGSTTQSAAKMGGDGSDGTYMYLQYIYETYRYNGYIYSYTVYYMNVVSRQRNYSMLLKYVCVCIIQQYQTNIQPNSIRGMLGMVSRVMFIKCQSQPAWLEVGELFMLTNLEFIMLFRHQFGAVVVTIYIFEYVLVPAIVAG